MSFQKPLNKHFKMRLCFLFDDVSRLSNREELVLSCFEQASIVQLNDAPQVPPWLSFLEFSEKSSWYHREVGLWQEVNPLALQSSQLSPSTSAEQLHCTG